MAHSNKMHLISLLLFFFFFLLDFSADACLIFLTRLNRIGSNALNQSIPFSFLFFFFLGFCFKGGGVGVYDTVLFEVTTLRHGLRHTLTVIVLGNSTCGGHSNALCFEFRSFDLGGC